MSEGRHFSEKFSSLCMERIAQHRVAVSMPEEMMLVAAAQFYEAALVSGYEFPFTPSFTESHKYNKNNGDLTLSGKLSGGLDLILTDCTLVFSLMSDSEKQQCMEIHMSLKVKGTKRFKQRYLVCKFNKADRTYQFEQKGWHGTKHRQK